MGISIRNHRSEGEGNREVIRRGKCGLQNSNISNPVFCIRENDVQNVTFSVSRLSRSYTSSQSRDEKREDAESKDHSISGQLESPRTTTGTSLLV